MAIERGWRTRVWMCDASTSDLAQEWTNYRLDAIEERGGVVVDIDLAHAIGAGAFAVESYAVMIHYQEPDAVPIVGGTEPEEPREWTPKP